VVGQLPVGDVDRTAGVTRVTVPRRHVPRTDSVDDGKPVGVLTRQDLLVHLSVDRLPVRET
jgi:CBS domain-containing protein